MLTVTYAECTYRPPYAECRYVSLCVVMLSVVMLSVVMLSVVMLSVVMLSVVMLSDVMLSVLAPLYSKASYRGNLYFDIFITDIYVLIKSRA
jgi:hypothetical protein